MDTVISLREFREEFREKLIEIHWRQWSSLGVVSQVEEEKDWIIDLEGLISSTLFIGKFERRLLSLSAEWIRKNGEWVNLSRLKRMGKYFYQVDKPLQEPLVPEKVFELIGNVLKNVTRQKELIGIKEAGSIYNLPQEYKEIFEKVEMRDKTTEPHVQKPCLLQLYLRGIFGVNARVEVLLYLLAKSEGNSRQIAREVYFDQKVVYRILERWARVGFVEKGPERKYLLKDAQEFIARLKLKDMPHYINWPRSFLLFARILQVLYSSPWAEEEYLLSSFFRDIVDEAKIIGRMVNISFSDSNLYRGSEYFRPFATELMQLMERI